MNESPTTEATESPLRDCWNRCEELVQQLMGVPLIGTDGGDYLYAPGEGLYVPGVESVIHEVSHWLVASESERKQRNYGLVDDWKEGDRAWLRSVLREEYAFNLEFFLLGDPSLLEFASLLTCDALATCAPSRCSPTPMQCPGRRAPIPEYNRRQEQRALRDAPDGWEVVPSEGLVARAVTAFETLRIMPAGSRDPAGPEDIRRWVLENARAPGVPLEELMAVAEKWRKCRGDGHD